MIPFGKITTAFDQEGNALTGIPLMVLKYKQPKKLFELLENIEDSYNGIKKIVFRVMKIVLVK